MHQRQGGVGAARGGGGGAHLLPGCRWSLTVSHPLAGTWAAVVWLEVAQGPPGAGLVPSVPTRDQRQDNRGPQRPKIARSMQNGEKVWVYWFFAF